ncbi:hypothetical protein H6P81_002900 [Aristolochia fimbriata]|uniref:Protein FAR1-RELATED SEQUENCE n=1 Tax=Aristolochia fimbriata TaxID=158543 RepID=A0AAV7FB16_ARIFI|nr:hypothetical protein H6P81_002900 [Aristolochia fimbriata]
MRKKRMGALQRGRSEEAGASSPERGKPGASSPEEGKRSFVAGRRASPRWKRTRAGNCVKGRCLRFSPLPVLRSRHLVIGQFNLGFIIGKLDSDLFIVDQCLLMDLPKTPLVDGVSSTSTYVPRGVQDGVSKIGMSFESVKDAEEGIKTSDAHQEIRNVERGIRMEKKDYDAELLIEHFKESQEINPSFFYRYETTQRSEGMNSFLDKYVNRKTTLSDFVLRFERALKRLRQRETEADHEMNYSKPLLKTDFDVEKQMVDIYTKFIFYKFQAEVVESVKYGALPLREERPFRIHEVYRCVQPDSINDVTREVNYDFDKKMANCTCMMFESEGVPCRHILLVLRNEKNCLLPESLILKRWTRTITREIVFYENMVELRLNLDEVVRIRRNDLASKIHKVLDVAFKSEEALSFLEKKIDVICDEIGQFEPDYGTKMRMPQEIHVHPPDIAKSKGSGKRLKGGKEKAMEQTAKKLRLCHGCGARGEH